MKNYMRLIKDNPGTIVRYLNKYNFFRIMSDERFLKYYWKIVTGKKLNLKQPSTFNEKIQWIKLFYRKPIMTTMVDKYLAKKYVAEKIGDEHIIPTLGVWDNADDINLNQLPEQFVLKCNHDSKDICICTNKESFDFNKAKEQLNKGLHRDFYVMFREWAYKNVKRKIIAEKYMVDESGNELKDYKIFNFNGEPKFIQVDYNRFNGHMRKIYDTQWVPANFTCLYGDDGRVFEKPKVLNEMLEYARILSNGFPFLRTDFYIINNNIYFGELTFYPEAGYGFFEPEAMDSVIGEWLILPDESR